MKTSSENLNLRYAQATVVSVSNLPDTGETPWWRMPLLVTVLVVISGIILAIPIHVRLRQRQKQ